MLLDAIVDLTVSGTTFRLTRGQVSNRLLQAATVHFSSPGKLRLTLAVRRGSDVAKLTTDCTLEPDRSRAALVWFYVLLPVGIILLFVLHQGLKFSPRKNAQ